MLEKLFGVYALRDRGAKWSQDAPVDLVMLQKAGLKKDPEERSEVGLSWEFHGAFSFAQRDGIGTSAVEI